MRGPLRVGEAVSVSAGFGSGFFDDIELDDQLLGDAGHEPQSFVFAPDSQELLLEVEFERDERGGRVRMVKWLPEIYQSELPYLPTPGR